MAKINIEKSWCCAYCDGTAKLKVNFLKLREGDVISLYYRCKSCKQEFTTGDVDGVTLKLMKQIKIIQKGENGLKKK